MRRRLFRMFRRVEHGVGCYLHRVRRLLSRCSGRDCQGGHGGGRPRRNGVPLGRAPIGKELTSRAVLLEVLHRQSESSLLPPELG